MPEDFTVQHGLYGEANMGLSASLQKMQTALDDLNQTLSQIESATAGKATPLWQERKTAWTATYEEMKGMFNKHTVANVRVADLFQEGDNTGARIMAG